MPHLPPRIGYALVLLVTAFGPAAGPRAAVVPPAPPAASIRPAADSSAFQVVLIPCVSGMCQVPMQGTPPLVPLKPAPPSPSSATPPYALAGR